MRRYLLVTLLLFYASPLTARTYKSAHYSYTTHNKALQKLVLTDCAWPETITLFEHHLHASISVDPKLAKRLFPKPIYFEFHDMEWPDALRVLALANKCDLAQDSPQQYRFFRP